MIDSLAEAVGGSRHNDRIRVPNGFIIATLTGKIVFVTDNGDRFPLGTVNANCSDVANAYLRLEN